MDPKRTGRRQARDKDSESNGSVNGDSAKKERKRRPAPPKRVKEEGVRPEGQYDAATPSSFKGDYRQNKSNVSPEPSSSNGSVSANRSIQPSPTNSTHLPPSRTLDEDYDEGVADSLLDLAYRDPRGMAAPSGSRIPASSPSQSHLPRRPSISSRTSPTTNKRPLSPGPDEHDVKRSRVGSMGQQRVSPPLNAPTPAPGSRLSPIPFRQQPTSHSPDRLPENARSYPASPQLPMQLPPHPRPIGSGLAGHGTPGGIGLPPLSTRSPPSNGGGATPADEERMQPHSSSRSASPPRGGAKREIVLGSGASGGSGSPTGAKGTPSPSSAASGGSSSGAPRPVP